jgi:hypothetical protein
MYTKKIVALLGFFCVSLIGQGAFAQTIRVVRVYIAPMESGTPEEQEYFMTSMKMEFDGAGYEITDTEEESDYYVIFSVSRQEEDTEAGENANLPQINTISLGLFSTKTQREVITLSWDYEQISDMNMWNLYLINQAMANAPILKIPADALPAEEEPGVKPEPEPKSNPLNKLFWVGLEFFPGYLYPQDGPSFSGALALEFDFLPFMGIGIGFSYRMLFPLVIDTENEEYSHIIMHDFFAPILLKFLFNAKNYYIIPYVGAEFCFGTLGLMPKADDLQTDEIDFIPAIMGGIDFRLPMGPGAFDMGIGGTYNFNQANTWNLRAIIGYKLGFFERKAKKNKQPPPEALP